jgi:tetratricopeptide (TPR) repeat protein
MIALHKEVNLLNEFGEPAKNAQGELASTILRGRAQALFSLDRLPEAAAAADRSISIKRGAPNLLMRARIALDQNNPAMAGKLVDEAFTLDPSSPAVIRARLKLLQRSGDAAKTLAYADQILKDYPATIPEARVARIEIFLKRNDNAQAKREVAAFFAVSRMFGTYYNAVLLSRAKDKKTAAGAILSLPKAFVKAHPEYAPQMAQIVIDNGNIEPGATILGYAIAANPNSIDARLRLAGLRMGQGSSQAALGALTPVEGSGDPRVQKLLGEIRAKIAKDRSF